MKQKIADAIFIILMAFIIIQGARGIFGLFHDKDCLCDVCEDRYYQEWLEGHPEAK